MKAFADSSALVKLYVDEPGSHLARTLKAAAVSALARVEVASALWRKQTSERRDPLAAASLVRHFEAAYAGTGRSGIELTPVAISEGILERAAEAARRPLRTLDAIQLASAMTVREVEPTLESFACYDRRLREAAAAEGFALLPPSL